MTTALALETAQEDAPATMLAEEPTDMRAPQPMSYAAYLELDTHSGLTEWVNGEVIFHMPAKGEHQDIVDFLMVLLRLFVHFFDLGLVRSAPFPMRAVPDGNAREPDLFFLAQAHHERLTRTALLGPADLVVEVVSDDSVNRDRDEKFEEYRAAGVPEYWIIGPRPNRQRADFYVLDERGRYQPVPLGLDDIYHSRVLSGLWLNVGWLWQPNPDALAALAAIVGPERLIAALHKPTGDETPA